MFLKFKSHGLIRNELKRGRPLTAAKRLAFRALVLYLNDLESLKEDLDSLLQALGGMGRAKFVNCEEGEKKSSEDWGSGAAAGFRLDYQPPYREMSQRSLPSHG